ncbi:papilin-like [Ornithodoros turicata]|uniref:papilin-like n=1 Tax=Ornithodoros turicata TaxID=34597 RepID=UPI003138BE27
MEPKVFVCIIMFFFGVSDSALGGLPGKCAVTRATCKKRSFLTRYYFNATKERCYSFFACPGEGDKFYPRMMECVRDCRPKQKPNKCFDKKAARCRGDTSKETAWTYDLKRTKCVKVDDACVDTKNKFVSQDQCAAECFGFDEKGLMAQYKNKKP